MTEYKSRFLKYYEENETKLDIIVFIGGFLFDIVTLSDIDDLFSIVQQVVYLGVIFLILYYEILFRMFKWKPGPKTVKAWEYRTLILHFFLGSLLSLYSLFYIKSASILHSLLFLGVMLLVLCANELPGVKKSNLSIKAGMFGICVFSFFSILFPLLLGFVGWMPLALAIVFTGAAFYGMYQLLLKKIPNKFSLMKIVIAPAASVIGLFLFFYIMGWIPPIPLSVVEQGIYHNVEKQNGEFLLSTEKKWWKFWQSGDQHFVARPGDKIFYYAQVYSPARFQDQIYIQWSQKNSKGSWIAADRIPLPITGGRKEGFRGFTYKTNYQPGEWRIQVLTTHGQEITRLDLEVQTSTATDSRNFEIIKR
ncbi:MAG: DUF2914 domain-containing protein [Bdellovibrionaceae bacterium]|nr:DUF2914 domain-containing protein [Pseudobdellovibrionaceae bacterium]